MRTLSAYDQLMFSSGPQSVQHGGQQGRALICREICTQDPCRPDGFRGELPPAPLFNSEPLARKVEGNNLSPAGGKHPIEAHRTECDAVGPITLLSVCVDGLPVGENRDWRCLQLVRSPGDCNSGSHMTSTRLSVNSKCRFGNLHNATALTAARGFFGLIDCLIGDDSTAAVSRGVRYANIPSVLCSLHRATLRQRKKPFPFDCDQRTTGGLALLSKPPDNEEIADGYHVARSVRRYSSAPLAAERGGTRVPLAIG